MIQLVRLENYQKQHKSTPRLENYQETNHWRVFTWPSYP